MSKYTYIQGYIKYRNKNALNQAIKILEKGGWMKEDGFVDEIEDPINWDGNETHVNRDNLELIIPFHSYRNLSYVLDDILLGATDANIVGTTTDGDFGGWYIKVEKEEGIRGELKNNLNLKPKIKEEYFDLDVWAKDNGFEVVEWIDDDENDTDNSEEVFEYQREVEDAFHDKYYKE